MAYSWHHVRTKVFVVLPCYRAVSSCVSVCVFFSFLASGCALCFCRFFLLVSAAATCCCCCWCYRYYCYCCYCCYCYRCCLLLLLPLLKLLLPAYAGGSSLFAALTDRALLYVWRLSCCSLLPDACCCSWRCCFCFLLPLLLLLLLPFLL